MIRFSIISTQPLKPIASHSFDEAHQAGRFLFVLTVELSENDRSYPITSLYRFHRGGRYSLPLSKLNIYCLSGQLISHQATKRRQVAPATHQRIPGFLHLQLRRTRKISRCLRKAGFVALLRVNCLDHTMQSSTYKGYEALKLTRVSQFGERPTAPKNFCSYRTHLTFQLSPRPSIHTKHISLIQSNRDA